MTAGLVWLIAAAVLAGAEALSGDFVLVMLAGGALGGAASAAVGAPVPVQAVVAALVAIVLVLFARPVAKRHFAVRQHHPTGALAVVGREAIALTAVDASGGRVKISGQEWSARSLGSTPIPPGATVHVLRIDGATAIVLDEVPRLPSVDGTPVGEARVEEDSP